MGRYLSRQFIENFMISHFIDEVFTDDFACGKRPSIDRVFPRGRERDAQKSRLIKNVKEGTVEYEMAFQRSLKQVKRRGLI